MNIAAPCRVVAGTSLWLCLAFCSGCASLTTQTLPLDEYELPRGEFAVVPDGGPSGEVPAERPPAELAKISLPDYQIEPPDILLIDGIRLVPKPPYDIEAGDILQIVVLGTQPERPIAGQYLVESEGFVNLGPGYGEVHVAGMTTTEAAEEIRDKLLSDLNQAEVSINVQAAGQQFITGEHLVGPDGTVNLGIYGRVYIAGMTLDQARSQIEKRLREYFVNPLVSLDVFVYNSKYFYVISEGGGIGDRVARIPITGNETVLDAIAQLGGFDQAASKKIWISRPTPGGSGCDQVLPVDWDAISRGAATATNYQLLPGDRLFIAENHLVAWSNLTSIFLNPFERVIGFSLLGAQTVQTLQRFPEGFQRGF